METATAKARRIRCLNGILNDLDESMKDRYVGNHLNWIYWTSAKWQLEDVNRCTLAYAASLCRCAADVDRYSCCSALSSIQSTVEGCVSEVQRFLCATDSSSEVRSALLHAFQLHDDSGRLERALRSDLARLRNGPEKGMRAKGRRLLGFLTCYNWCFHLRDRWPVALLGWVRDLVRAVPIWLSLLWNITIFRALAPLGWVEFEYCEPESDAELLTLIETARLPYPERLHKIRELYLAGKVQAERAVNFEEDTLIQAWCRLVLQALILDSQQVESGVLPGALTESSALTDPYTGQPFKYQRLDEGYRLSSPGPDVTYGGDDEAFWGFSTFTVYKHVSLTILKGKWPRCCVDDFEPIVLDDGPVT